MGRPIPSPLLPLLPPHPPVRSAVPLGGIGAGAFEVRADGSVHEFTIINMSPGARSAGVGEAGEE